MFLSFFLIFNFLPINWFWQASVTAYLLLTPLLHLPLCFLTYFICLVHFSRKFSTEFVVLNWLPNSVWSVCVVIKHVWSMMYHKHIFHSTYINQKEIIRNTEPSFLGSGTGAVAGRVPQTNINSRFHRQGLKRSYNASCTFTSWLYCNVCWQCLYTTII